MLDHTIAAVSSPPTRPSRIFVTIWVLKTPAKPTDWYHSTSVQNCAAMAMTTSSAAATTRDVTSGRRVGGSVAASGRRGGPESSSLKLPGGGPKLLSLTWSALGAGAGRWSGGPVGSLLRPPAATITRARAAPAARYRNVTGTRPRASRAYASGPSQGRRPVRAGSAPVTPRHTAAWGRERAARHRPTRHRRPRHRAARRS